MIKSVKTMGMVLFAALIAACSTPDNPVEKYRNVPEVQLYREALADMKDDSYRSASEKWEALDARYPFGDYSEQNHLYIIYAYYQIDEMPESLVAADRFIHVHPDSAHVDYAYFMKGVLNFRQSQGVFEKYFESDLAERDMSPAKQSYITFATLVENYPASRYRNAAIQYMTYLRNLMAEQELHIAQFYFARHAYIATINRTNNIILHYQGAPVMPEALLLLERSYRALKMDDMADIAQEIHKIND